MGKQGKTSPTVVKTRASTSSLEDHATTRPTYSCSIESPQHLNTRKSCIASPERTILTTQTIVPKLKPAAAWKSTLKNDTIPHRRRSLGHASVDQNVEHSKGEQDGYQRAGVDKLKNNNTIVRQSSDSELKRKVKTRLSLTKTTTTQSTKDGLSLDEYSPSKDIQNETTSFIVRHDDDTVHTDPFSGTKRTEPRRALRGSIRRSSGGGAPSAAANTEGSSSPRRRSSGGGTPSAAANTDGSSSPRLRSRSRSIPRRPSSWERKRAEIERTEAIKFLTATTTTTTPPSSFIDLMTSSFSSANSGSSQANDALQQHQSLMDAHDKTRSHHETKLEARLEEAEARNYHLMRKVEDLESKLVQAQAENEVTYARNRRSKLGCDRLLVADRDKDIHGLCDSLALSLNHGEPKAKEETQARNSIPTSTSLTEIRLQNELRDARAKIASLEKCLSDAREHNALLQAEIRSYQAYDSSKYSPPVWAAET